MARSTRESLCTGARHIETSRKCAERETRSVAVGVRTARRRRAPNDAQHRQHLAAAVSAVEDKDEIEIERRDRDDVDPIGR